MQVELGNDKDYIIDYNSGEINFNASFPILSDMRVKVEYQVSEKNFNNFVAFTNINFEKKLSSHNISFYNENDIKNQPIMQDIPYKLDSKFDSNNAKFDSNESTFRFKL